MDDDYLSILRVLKEHADKK